MAAAIDARKLVSKFSEFSLAAFVLTIGIDFTFNRIFLVVLYVAMFAAFITAPEKTFSLRYWRLLPIFFFLIYLVSAFASTDVKNGLKTVEKLLPFALLPLLWTNSFSQHANLNRTRVVLIFVYGSFIICIICLAMACYHSLAVIDGKLVFDARVLKDDRIDFFQSITWGGNYFFSSCLSVFMHPSYFAMYVSLAIFIIVEQGCVMFGRKIFGYLLIIFFLIIIYLLSSKGAYVAMLVAAIAYMFLKVDWRLLSWQRKLAITLSCVIAVIILFSNPRFMTLLHMLRSSGFQLNKEGTYSDGARLLTWSAAIDLVREKPVLGYGSGDTEATLLKYYEVNGFKAPLERQYNVHNQYLETWVATGIAGFLVMSLMFFGKLVLASREQDKIVAVFLTLFSIHCFFESMLNRYNGIVFFIFFYTMFIAASDAGKTGLEAGTMKRKTGED